MGSLLEVAQLIKHKTRNTWNTKHETQNSKLPLVSERGDFGHSSLTRKYHIEWFVPKAIHVFLLSELLPDK